ncbi:MAG: hypothetical protein M1838_000338 [Thelocarpon superellum]|nr:MAG: hypothetical protein M1838_000338 [Thelocarpon superellum]
MLSGLMFAFWRWLEIITLIPTVGILAYFVNGFVSNYVLTPNFILVLFVTSVLAVVWAIMTLLAYHRAKHSAIFVALVDLGFVGCFVAGVVLLRGIAPANCAYFTDQSYYNNSFFNSLGPFGGFGASYGFGFPDYNKTCGLLKAAFAFGIMNCVFFFITAILALSLHRRNVDTVKETHVTRTRRSGSHHSRSSRNSRRRQYYV